MEKEEFVQSVNIAPLNHPTQSNVHQELILHQHGTLMLHHAWSALQDFIVKLMDLKTHLENVRLDLSALEEQLNRNQLQLLVMVDHV